MTVQLSKAQIDAIKVELAKVGLDVRPLPKPRAIRGGKAKPHFMWYKPPSLAALGKGVISTASHYGSKWHMHKDDLNSPNMRDRVLKAHAESIAAMRQDAEKIGVHFPH